MPMVSGTPGVDALSEVVGVLREWQHDGMPMQLHPGDLGWFWRFGAEVTAAAVRTWSRDGQILAVGLLDGPRLLRLAIAPGSENDEELAQRLFESVWQVIDTTTLVDITSPGYLDVYNLIFGIAVVLMLGLASLQLVTGVIRRDPTAPQRAGLGLARSVLGSFVVITITAALLEIVDQLCIGIVQATGSSMEEMGDRVAALAAGLAVINVGAPGVGVILTIFLAGLAIVGAVLVWFSLLIRKALLLVAIVLAPLALSGQSWDVAKGWFARWATFVLALILSKLIVVVVFLVAVTQVSAPIDADLASISDPIAGVVLMLVAAFAPFMAYTTISFIGTDLYHAVSTEQEAKSAMNRPVPVPSKPAMDTATKVLNDESGAGSPAARSQSVGAHRTRDGHDRPRDAPTPDSPQGGSARSRQTVASQPVGASSDASTGDASGTSEKPVDGGTGGSAGGSTPGAGSPGQASVASGSGSTGAAGERGASGPVAAGVHAASAGAKTGSATGDASEAQHDAASQAAQPRQAEAGTSSASQPSETTPQGDAPTQAPASRVEPSSHHFAGPTADDATGQAGAAEPRPTPPTPVTPAREEPAIPSESEQDRSDE